jgi:hypothetical protein
MRPEIPCAVRVSTTRHGVIPTKTRALVPNGNWGGRTVPFGFPRRISLTGTHGPHETSAVGARYDWHAASLSQGVQARTWERIALRKRPKAGGMVP